MAGSRVRIETCDGVGGSPPMTARFEPPRLYLPAPLHCSFFVQRHFYYAFDNAALRRFAADTFETTYSFTVAFVLGWVRFKGEN